MKIPCSAVRAIANSVLKSVNIVQGAPPVFCMRLARPRELREPERGCVRWDVLGDRKKQACQKRPDVSAARYWGAVAGGKTGLSLRDRY